MASFSFCCFLNSNVRIPNFLKQDIRILDLGRHTVIPR